MLTKGKSQKDFLLAAFYFFEQNYWKPLKVPKEYALRRILLEENPPTLFWVAKTAAAP